MYAALEFVNVLNVSKSVKIIQLSRVFEKKEHQLFFVAILNKPEAPFIVSMIVKR
jgi:hypothetical protein